MYIYTGDPIYSRLYDITVRKNMVVNELLKQWGYERYYRPQLDPSQAPYDWRKDLEQDVENDENNCSSKSFTTQLTVDRLILKYI